MSRYKLMRRNPLNQVGWEDMMMKNHVKHPIFSSQAQKPLALASAQARLDEAIRAKRRGKSASWLAAGCMVVRLIE